MCTVGEKIYILGGQLELDADDDTGHICILDTSMKKECCQGLTPFEQSINFLCHWALTLTFTLSRAHASLCIPHGS